MSKPANPVLLIVFSGGGDESRQSSVRMSKPPAVFVDGPLAEGRATDLPRNLNRKLNNTQISYWYYICFQYYVYHPTMGSTSFNISIIYEHLTRRTDPRSPFDDQDLPGECVYGLADDTG